MFVGAVVGALFIVHSLKFYPLAIALIVVATIAASTRVLGCLQPRLGPRRRPLTTPLRLRNAGRAVAGLWSG